MTKYDRQYFLGKLQEINVRKNNENGKVKW